MTSHSLRIRIAGWLLVALVALIATMSSCTSSRVASTQVEHRQSDTTMIVERLRVDTITIQGDTLIVELPIDCDSNLRVRPVVAVQQSKRSNAKLEVRNNMVLAQLNCNEYKQEVYVRDSIIKRLQSENHSRFEVKVVEHKYIPTIFWIALILWIVVILYFLGRLAFWAYRKYLTGGLL